MAFFVFESLTRRPLHPMQYLLVGLSLVLFYLVLLALSEHIGFTAAAGGQPVWRGDEWDLPSGGAQRMA